MFKLRNRMGKYLKDLNVYLSPGGYYLHMATDNFGDVRVQINRDSLKRKVKKVLGLGESPLRQVGEEQIADLGVSFDMDKEGKICKLLNGYIFDCEKIGFFKYSILGFEKNNGLVKRYILRKPTQDLDNSDVIRD